MTSFYWEIGDGNPDDTRSGSVGPGAPVNSDSMNIASASKWLYAAYVAEKFGGVLSAYDIRFLTMSSGYVGMGPDQCNPTTSTGPETVNQCLAHGTNSDYTPGLDGYWIYNSGHFENHAVHAGIGSSGNVIDLGSDNETALATEMTTTLHHVFLFSQPLLAGGVVTTPARYAAFLQDILQDHLQMHDLLGTSARCTNDTDLSCSTTIAPPLSNGNPIPHDVYWDYSIGHWVESDPDHPAQANADGSYSSAGSRGFYPWIDSTQTWYGLVARDANRTNPDGSSVDEGWNSFLCGARVQLAWMTATHQ